MSFSQLKAECEKYYEENKNTISKKELYEQMLNQYIRYCVVKESLQQENIVSSDVYALLKLDTCKFKDIISQYYNLDCLNHDNINNLVKPFNASMKQNIKNWLDGTSRAEKKNIIAYVLLLIDIEKKEIDYLQFCNELLQVLGYDALHSRKVEESFAIFCLHTKKGKKYYDERINKVKKYIENIPKPRPIYVNVKNLSTTTINKVLSADMSVIEDGGMKNLMEKLRNRLENFDYNTIETMVEMSALVGMSAMDEMSALDEMQKLSEQIIEKNSTPSAKDAFNKLVYDSKKKYKTLIKNVAKISENISKIRPVYVNAKRLFKIINNILSADMSVIKDDGMKSLVEKLKVKLEHFNYSMLETTHAISALNEIQELSEQIIVEKSTPSAIDAFNKLIHDSKRKYKTLINNIAEISPTIQDMYNIQLKDISDRLSSTNVEEQLESYTTHFFSSELNKLNEFEDFMKYLEDYGKYFTINRNKTIKNLMDALRIRYINVKSTKKINFRQIGIDYECFYFSKAQGDLITMNPSRARQPSDEVEIDTLIRLSIGKKCLYNTEKELSQFISGEKILTRSSYVSWLIFSGLDIKTINDYLEQSEFAIIDEDGSDSLSELVCVAYYLREKFGKELCDILKDLYIQYWHRVTWDFPLYSHH